MNLHILDHLFFVAIAVVMPIHGYYWLRKRKALIKAGRDDLRMKIYRDTIREQWILTVVLVGVWFALGRGATELGFGLPGGLLVWGGYALAVFVCAVIVIQMKSATASPENLVKFREQIGDNEFLLPHTLKERHTFDFVSLTAGICEEIIFRGFGIAYLMALLGVPFWAAALISSAIFGLSHLYQGPIGFVRTGSIGLVFAALYGLTGALWAPMVLHFLVDIAAGRASFVAFSRSCPEDTPTEQVA